MNQEVPKDVLDAFTSNEADFPSHSPGTISIYPIGHGLINQSWRVSGERKPDLFLQQINKDVFEKPKELQQNYIHLWEYAEFGFTGQRIPAPFYYQNGRSLYRDQSGNYWRAFEWIAECKTLLKADNASRAKATAQAFAKFTAAFAEMNTGLLHDVIPGFHDLSFRYRQFEDSLKTEHYERMAKSVGPVNELKQRERYKHFYELITESADFPKRVMHHDAKISNILFHERTGRMICPVDYDTVMPGYYFSDLGDMIRSMAGTVNEDSKDMPSINKGFYEAILAGYTEVLGNALTELEKKYINAAGLLMIYMQSLRFMTDYLQGDRYYKISYPEQNLDRAINQLSLLKNLEEFLMTAYGFRI